MTCHFCDEVSGECDTKTEDYNTNAYDYQELTNYGSTVEYECSLGREFEMDDGTTQAIDTLSCNWKEEWEPRATLQTCVCKCTTSDRIDA